MSTHHAIIATGIKEPLTLQRVSTATPKQHDIQVRAEWIPSAPLDVFQVDAGLMAQFPLRLGDSVAGTVVAVGSSVQHLKVGDRVFGFVFHAQEEKGQQIYVTAPEHLFGKIPDEVSLAAASTIPTNFVTAFHALSEKLEIQLPWPCPQGFVSHNQEIPILIWGGGSSVGQFAVQILKNWGYKNVIVTASPKHEGKLKRYGAAHVIDYRSPNVVDSIMELLNANKFSKAIRVFDCVDSKFGSLLPISEIAIQAGSKVAAVLPVVINGPSDETGLQLSADVSKEADWVPGVEIHSIVSYSYEANAFLKDNLMSDILPTLLSQGAIEPNEQRVIEGNTLLERASTALDIMRSGTVSGERLVWKVWTAEEFPEYQ
jgi:NADPH:quinone reductase-like Zn-dependent oxidoreductase